MSKVDDLAELYCNTFINHFICKHPTIPIPDGCFEKNKAELSKALRAAIDERVEAMLAERERRMG